MSLKYLIVVAALLASACAGDGPTSPSATPAPPVVQAPPPPPAPLFTISGIGNTVFDMPTTVKRVKITGDYPGRSQNFIAHCGGGFSLVNVILGTSDIAIGPHYEATALTTGGVCDTTHSEGVSWSFTEVR